MKGCHDSRRIGRRAARLNIRHIARCLAEQQRMSDVTDPVTWDHPGQPIPGGVHR
jgi:hypothetical protein